MKNLSIVIFVILNLSCGSLARIIAVLSKVQDPSAVLVDKNETRDLVRNKRQFGFGPFGQSSANANANAFNNYYGPQGFGSSSALAGAQSFNSQSPFGGFGASAANSGSQGFNCGYTGCSGNANFGASQSYQLPGGKSLSFALSRGVNFAPGQQPTFTNGDSFSFGK